jgi:hypothetical protein
MSRDISAPGQDRPHSADPVGPHLGPLERKQHELCAHRGLHVLPASMSHLGTLWRVIITTTEPHGLLPLIVKYPQIMGCSLCSCCSSQGTYKCSRSLVPGRAERGLTACLWVRLCGGGRNRCWASDRKENPQTGLIGTCHCSVMGGPEVWEWLRRPVLKTPTRLLVR